MKIRMLLTVIAILASREMAPAQTVLSVAGPVNSASFMQGLPRGGALATVFVFGLTGNAGLLIAPSSSPLPFELGGVRVTVNRAPAPILGVVIPAAGSSAPG